MRTLVLLSLAIVMWANGKNSFATDAARTSPDEQKLLLAAVCGEKAGEDGCEVCPANTDFPSDHLKLKAVFYGHFLDPHSVSAALMFQGCESHAAGLGGTFLLERVQGEWKQVTLRPGLERGDCKKLAARDGRDVLICSASDMHAGVRDDFLDLVDFKRDAEEDQGNPIFFMLNDSIPNCSEQAVSGEIEQVNFKPLPGRWEITVLARLGAAHLTEAEVDYCQTHEASVLAMRLATVPRAFRFIFDGETVKGEPGNPPMERGAALPPVTRVIVPYLFTAADKAFTIRVPLTYRILIGEKLAAAAELSPMPVCQRTDSACFVYPAEHYAGTNLQAAAIEITLIDSKDEHACLNPVRLPHSPAVSQALPFSNDYRLGDMPWKYAYWEGATAANRIDQETFRAWHNGRCYQLAANIAETTSKTRAPFTDKDETDVYQEMGAILEGFRFANSHTNGR